MLMYILKRVLRAVVTLAIIMSIVFVLLRQMPVEGYFPNYDKMSKLQIESGLHQMGLDQPMPVQLWRHTFLDVIEALQVPLFELRRR